MILITAFVGMGSNVGDRLAHFRRAIIALDEAEGVAVERISCIYETEAHVRHGQEAQPDHLNAVVQIRTSLSAQDLLGVLKRIEIDEGRELHAPEWSPRPLDLDLLIFGDTVIESEILTVPHPRIAERRFVLQPLSDLVHNLAVPGADGASVSDLLERCTDTNRVERTAFRLDEDPALHQ